MNRSHSLPSTASITITGIGRQLFAKRRDSLRHMPYQQEHRSWDHASQAPCNQGHQKEAHTVLHLFYLLTRQPKRGHLMFLSSSRWSAKHPNLFYFFATILFPLVMLGLLALGTAAVAWPVAALLGLI